jgi:hypothetical protein
MGWLIFWVVIIVVAFIIGGATDSFEAGAITFVTLALIGGLVWVASSACASCQDKTDPGRQATVEAQNANVQAQETAEAQTAETPEPTATPYPYGTELYLDPKKDGHNSKIGEVNCLDKLIVKSFANTIDGYYYLVVPECSANQKNYLPNVMNDEESLTTEAPDLPPCGCGETYSADPTPEPTEED